MCVKYITLDDDEGELEAGGGGDRHRHQNTFTDFHRVYSAQSKSRSLSGRVFPKNFYEKFFARKILGVCLFRAHDRIHDQQRPRPCRWWCPQWSCQFMVFSVLCPLICRSLVSPSPSLPNHGKGRPFRH